MNYYQVIATNTNDNIRKVYMVVAPDVDKAKAIVLYSKRNINVLSTVKLCPIWGTMILDEKQVR